MLHPVLLDYFFYPLSSIEKEKYYRLSLKRDEPAKLYETSCRKRLDEFSALCFVF